MAPTADERGAVDAGGFQGHRMIEERIGQTVAGTYRITRHVGSGGSSHVFAAEHVRLGKAFAVKLLRTELDCSRRAAQRFRREAKAVARLQSEYIVSVIDCGELDDQTPYLVMELLEGEDLRSLLKREGSLPARRSVQIVIEACHGLMVVHESGLVHRDLKPENLFITRRAGGEDWCKVLDFGVAKMKSSLSTAQGAIIGTVRYMAPEQLSDVDSVGPATDVYALGAVLYECLTGKAAQAGETVQEVMFGVMHKEPQSLSLSRPELPKGLVTAVMRCLAKRPSDRVQTPAELAALLAACLRRDRTVASSLTLSEEAAPPDVEGAHPAPPKWRAAAALVIAALAGGGLSWSAKPDHLVPATAAHLPVLAAPSAPLPSESSAIAASSEPISGIRPGEAIPSDSVASSSSSRLPFPRRRAPVPVPTAGPAHPGSGPAGLDQANPYGE